MARLPLALAGWRNPAASCTEARLPLALAGWRNPAASCTELFEMRGRPLITI